jgi:hypothetical protein
MVDVLCCALGCVILLWLVNLREAKQRALAASQTSEELRKVQAEIDQAHHRLFELQSLAKENAVSLATLQDAEKAALRRLDAAEQAGAQSARKLATVEGQLQQQRSNLAALSAERTEFKERLELSLKQEEKNSKELVDARQHLAETQTLLRDKEAESQALARTAAEQLARLREADALLRRAQDAEGEVPNLRAEAREYRNRAGGLESRVQLLEADLRNRNQDLAALRRTSQELQEDKEALTARIGRERAASEDRFAGLALTGRRVVFLVDMSGSMEMVDDNTAAPEKWLAVRQALSKIMRSLPDLEKFQVLLFSTRVTYPLGKEGSWIDYNATISADRVATALAAVKPKGNTDMYAGFEAAFHMRPSGLDTIYLLSDGLPNVGRGLDPEAARRMSETERSEILSKYIRQTLRLAWNRPRAGEARVRINTVGFFYESPDVGAFLWALARDNDGGFVGMSKP